MSSTIRSGPRLPTPSSCGADEAALAVDLMAGGAVLERRRPCRGSAEACRGRSPATRASIRRCVASSSGGSDAVSLASRASTPSGLGRRNLSRSAGCWSRLGGAAPPSTSLRSRSPPSRVSASEPATTAWSRDGTLRITRPSRSGGEGPSDRVASARISCGVPVRPTGRRRPGVGPIGRRPDGTTRSPWPPRPAGGGVGEALAGHRLEGASRSRRPRAAASSAAAFWRRVTTSGSTVGTVTTGGSIRANGDPGVRGEREAVDHLDHGGLAGVRTEGPGHPPGRVVARGQGLGDDLARADEPDAHHVLRLDRLVGESEVAADEDRLSVGGSTNSRERSVPVYASPSGSELRKGDLPGRSAEPLGSSRQGRPGAVASALATQSLAPVPTDASRRPASDSPHFRRSSGSVLLLAEAIAHGHQEVELQVEVAVASGRRRRASRHRRRAAGSWRHGRGTGPSARGLTGSGRGSRSGTPPPPGSAAPARPPPSGRRPASRA